MEHTHIHLRSVGYSAKEHRLLFRGVNKPSQNGPERKEVDTDKYKEGTIQKYALESRQKFEKRAEDLLQKLRGQDLVDDKDEKYVEKLSKWLKDFETQGRKDAQQLEQALRNGEDYIIKLEDKLTTGGLYKTDLPNGKLLRERQYETNKANAFKNGLQAITLSNGVQFIEVPQQWKVRETKSLTLVKVDAQDISGARTRVFFKPGAKATLDIEVEGKRFSIEGKKGTTGLKFEFGAVANYGKARDAELQKQKLIDLGTDKSNPDNVTMITKGRQKFNDHLEVKVPELTEKQKQDMSKLVVDTVDTLKNSLQGASLEEIKQKLGNVNNMLTTLQWQKGKPVDGAALIKDKSIETIKVKDENGVEHTAVAVYNGGVTNRGRKNELGINEYQLIEGKEMENRAKGIRALDAMGNAKKMGLAGYRVEVAPNKSVLVNYNIDAKQWQFRDMLNSEKDLAVSAWTTFWKSTMFSDGKMKKVEMPQWKGIKDLPEDWDKNGTLRSLTFDKAKEDFIDSKEAKDLQDTVAKQVKFLEEGKTRIMGPTKLRDNMKTLNNALSSLTAKGFDVRTLDLPETMSFDNVGLIADTKKKEQLVFDAGDRVYKLADL